MSTFDSSKRERLTQLLTEKLDLFEQIFDLCQEQAKLISKDKMEETGKSAGKIAALRTKIEGLHQELDGLMQSYSSVSGGNKDEEIEHLIKENKEAIEDCAELNEENVAKIKAKAEEHIKKIDEHSAKRKGIGGYAQAVVGSPEMFDKKT